MTYDSGWRVMIVETVTGKIVNNDLPVSEFPTFDRMINTSGKIQIKILLGDGSLPQILDLRQLLAPWRYSIAIAYGTYIATMGPIITSNFDDTTRLLSVSCGDFWSLLKMRIIINSATPPTQTTATSLLPMDSTRDLGFGVYSLRGIASGLVTNAIARTGFSLPVDIPSPEAGTAVRNYPVYDLASVYTRLTDLIAVNGGPDVDFLPYFDLSNPGYARWSMSIGTPLISQATAFYFDYGSNLRSVVVDSNGSNMVSAMYTKGNTTERASSVAYSVNSVLVNAGWPALESVDTTHTSATDAATIQGYADSDLVLYASPVEIWTAIVAVDASSSAFGTYNPGSIAVFNMQGHGFIPDGTYSQRILGFSNSSVGPITSVKLILQAVQGAV